MLTLRWTGTKFVAVLIVLMTVTFHPKTHHQHSTHTWTSQRVAHGSNRSPGRSKIAQLVLSAAASQNYDGACANHAKHGEIL